MVLTRKVIYWLAFVRHSGMVRKTFSYTTKLLRGNGQSPLGGVTLPRTLPKTLPQPSKIQCFFQKLAARSGHDHLAAFLKDSARDFDLTMRQVTFAPCTFVHPGTPNYHEYRYRCGRGGWGGVGWGGVGWNRVGGVGRGGLGWGIIFY
jgi:hypothetical protein